jgi:hypothetical protein
MSARCGEAWDYPRARACLHALECGVSTFPNRHDSHFELAGTESGLAVPVVRSASRRENGASRRNTVRAGGNTVRAGGKTVRAGGKTVRAGGKTVRAGGKTVRAGGKTVRAGGKTVRAGGKTVRAGGKTVRAGGRTVRAGGKTVRAGGCRGEILGCHGEFDRVTVRACSRQRVRSTCRIFHRGHAPSAAGALRLLLELTPAMEQPLQLRLRRGHLGISLLQRAGVGSNRRILDAALRRL